MSLTERRNRLRYKGVGYIFNTILNAKLCITKLGEVRNAEALSPSERVLVAKGFIEGVEFAERFIEDWEKKGDIT